MQKTVDHEQIDKIAAYGGGAKKGVMNPEIYVLVGSVRRGFEQILIVNTRETRAEHLNNYEYEMYVQVVAAAAASTCVDVCVTDLLYNAAGREKQQWEPLEACQPLWEQYLEYDACDDHAELKQQIVGGRIVWGQIYEYQIIVQTV